MAISATALTIASMAATAVSTGLGVVSSLQQSKAQQAQAEYQADVARQNQELAEQQASAERKAGYENMIAKRQETARLIGRQRAAAGASGAAVDVGSNLDLQADTASRGEIDAISLYNQGLDRGYNSEIQAWNYGSQAEAYDSQASAAGANGWMSAAGTALGGIASIGSTWGNYASKQSGGQWVNNNQDYIDSSGKLTKIRSRSGKIANI